MELSGGRGSSTIYGPVIGVELARESVNSVNRTAKNDRGLTRTFALGSFALMGDRIEDPAKDRMSTNSGLATRENGSLEADGDRDETFDLVQSQMSFEVSASSGAHLRQTRHVKMPLGAESASTLSRNWMNVL